MVNMKLSNTYYATVLGTRAKINDIFKDKLSTKELNDLTALVYYPEDKLQLIKCDFQNYGQLNVWYITTIEHLIQLIKYCSSKYTRSKLRRALPEQYVFIVEELLYKTTNSKIKILLRNTCKSSD